MKHSSIPEYPCLQTERLYLRELTLDDASAVHFSDPQVTELMQIDVCTDLDTAR